MTEVHDRDILGRSVHAHPCKPALIFRQSRLTYTALNETVDRFINGLETISQSDNLLGIWLPNGPHLIGLLLACFRIGIVPVPFHSRMKPGEITTILHAAGIKNLITTKSLFASLAVLPEYSNNVSVYEIDSEGTASCMSRCDPENYVDSVNDCGLIPGDTCLVLHTSGSEGSPKGVCISWDSISHIINYRLAFTTLSERSVSIVASCLTQSMGLYQTLAMLSAGGTIVLLEDYKTVPLVQSINTWHPTHLIMVVDAWQQVLFHPDLEINGLQHLEFASVGADKVTRTVQDRFIELNGFPLHVTYGLTESSWALVNLSGDHNKALSIGKPGPDIDIRLLDKNAAVVATGEIGEIHIRSPRNMLGYLDDFLASRDGCDNGWLASGDLALCDKDGYYWYAGRCKNLIVLPTGDNVSPVEIETVLLACPGVTECLVTGVYDAEGFERPIAYVVPENATLTVDDLTDYLHENLSEYKVPREIILLDNLPRGYTGKLQAIGV